MMASYTAFEATFLVASYLASEELEKQIVQVDEVLEIYPLEYRKNWIRRALLSFNNSGFGKGRMHSGREEQQYVHLTPAGVKEAERLLDEGTVNIRVPETSTSDSVITVPASDRIVSLSDNAGAVGEVRQAVAAVSQQLTEGNDFGDLTHEEVEEAKREIWHLEQALQHEALRVDWFARLANTCLKWIAEKASGAAVGDLAKNALRTILNWLGF